MQTKLQLFNLNKNESTWKHKILIQNIKNYTSISMILNNTDFDKVPRLIYIF